jgi:hypothetical protein
MFGASSAINYCKQLSEHLLCIVEYAGPGMVDGTRTTMDLDFLRNDGVYRDRYLWVLAFQEHVKEFHVGHRSSDSPFPFIFILLTGLWGIGALVGYLRRRRHNKFKNGMIGYDISIYASPKLLPLGAAVLSAFSVGVAGVIPGMAQVWFVGRVGVAGAILGMAQVWFVGPVGKRVGGAFGGDVVFEMGFEFAAISYIVFRNIELRRIGR